MPRDFPTIQAGVDAARPGSTVRVRRGVRGGEVGIGVGADFIDTLAVLRGDDIRRTTVAPVQEIACCGFSATAIVERH